MASEIAKYKVSISPELSSFANFSTQFTRSLNSVLANYNMPALPAPEIDPTTFRIPAPEDLPVPELPTPHIPTPTIPLPNRAPIARWFDEVGEAMGRRLRQISALPSRAWAATGSRLIALSGRSLTAIGSRISTGIARVWDRLPDGLTRGLSRVGTGIAANLRPVFAGVAAAAGRVGSSALNGVRTLAGNLGSGLSRAGSAIGSSLSRAASGIAGSLSKATGFVGSALSKVGMVTVGGLAGIGAAIAGIAVGKGISRALNIDEATTKLKALGYEGDALKGVMDSALASVKGTSYGLGDAATIAAQALAAGVPQGEALTNSLKIVTNTAALAGTSLSDMGSIFTKVWASGKVSTEELNQLADRGVPIWTTLADGMGVSVDTLKEMVSEGQVTAQMFQDVLGPSVEGLAGVMGTSFKGMLANLGAAMGRLGALFAGPAIEALKPWIGYATALVDLAATKLKPAAEAFTAFISGIKPPDPSNFSIDGILAVFDGIGPRLLISGGQTVMKFYEGIYNALPEIIDGVISFLTTVVSTIQDYAPKLVEGWATIFTTLVDNLAIILPVVINAVTDLLPKLVLAILEQLPTLVDAILNGLLTLLLTIVDVVPKVLPNIIDAIVLIVPAIVVALVEMLPLIVQAATKLLKGITEALPIILPVLINGVMDLIDSIANLLPTLIPVLMTAGQELFFAIIDVIPQLFPLLWNAWVLISNRLIPVLANLGKQLVVGLWNGFAEAIPNLLKNLGKFMDTVVKSFKDFFGIKSPSVLMRKEIGLYVGQGVGAGITDATTYALKKATDFSARLSSAMNVDANVQTDFSASANGAAERGTPTVIVNQNVDTPNSLFQLYLQTRKGATAGLAALG